MKENPTCLVVGCNESVIHSFWDNSDPVGTITYFCPTHITENLMPDKSYTIEPWKTELTESQVETTLRQK